MKQFSIGLLVLAFIITAVAPTAAYAKKGGDDDRFEYRSGDYEFKYRYDHDDDDNDDDQDEDEDDSDDNDDDSNDDDDSDESLEVEADVFTDMTIVKVELRNGKKTVFRTDADTKEEVVDVVADKFNLTEEEVEDVLDFEIENRASRPKERAKITGVNNNPVDNCDDNSTTTLQVEADVFTDTTIVKVERNNTKTVFETDATTSAAVVAEVADRLNIDEDDVEDVIDFEVEDRASRSSDFVISSSNSNDDCDDDNSSNNNNNDKDAELRARINQLQNLIENLIRLLNLRLGSGN